MSRDKLAEKIAGTVTERLQTLSCSHRNYTASRATCIVCTSNEVAQAVSEARSGVLTAVADRLTPLREKLDLLLCDEGLDDEKLRKASENLLPLLADAIRRLSQLQQGE